MFPFYTFKVEAEKESRALCGVAVGLDVLYEVQLYHSGRKKAV